MNKALWAVIAVAVVAVVGTRIYVGEGKTSQRMNSHSQPAMTVNVKVPKLSQIAKLGEKDFSDNCAACHGEKGSGTENGPPLVHRIYEPNHHPDYSFKAAAKAGVSAHHWRFGNMPPQQHVTEAEIDRIIVYVRELQKENGIL